MSPTMQERGLPLDGEELRKYVQNIPSSLLKEYARAANGYIG